MAHAILTSKKKNDLLWVDVDTAAEITAVELGTLLDWERFFYPFLDPERVRGESRYKKADLDIIFQIKRLIQEGGFRKEGAKRALAWSYKRVA